MDISYLHGRSVVAVLDQAAAKSYDQDAVWAIQLEGEGYIFCFDPSHAAPVLDGLAFTKSTVTDTEARLYFGTDSNPTGTVIVMRPQDYGVMDDLYSEGAIVRGAQDAQEAAAVLEPDPNMGTTPDGPSEAYLASQEEAKASAPKAEYFDPEQDHGA